MWADATGAESMRTDQNWIFYNKVALHANMVIESLQRCFIILFWGESWNKTGDLFSLPFPPFFVKISAAVMFQFVRLENFNLIFHASILFLDRRNWKGVYSSFELLVMFYSKISSINWPKQKQKLNLLIWPGDYWNFGLLIPYSWQKVLENITCG